MDKAGTIKRLEEIKNYSTRIAVLIDEIAEGKGYLSTMGMSLSNQEILDDVEQILREMK